MVDEAHPELGSRNFKEMWGKAGKTRNLYAQKKGVKFKIQKNAVIWP